MSYVYERFGTITLPLYNRETNQTPVAPRQQIAATVAGAFDGDGTGRSDQQYPHALSLEAAVTADSTTLLRAALDVLRAAVGTRAYLYRRADDDSDVHRALCRLVGMTLERSYKTHLAYQMVRMQFAQLGQWEGDNHASWALDDGSLFDDGLLLDSGDYSQALSSTSASQTVANGGNLPVHSVQIAVTAGSAALTSVRITGTGFDLQWTGTIAAGQTLAIDCAAQSVLLSGVDAYSGFALGDGHTIEDWISLEPGNTTISLAVTGTITGAGWNIEFRDGWA